MKESFFIKLVKYFYGINRPFDEFTRSIINEAGNKIAIWLIVYLLVSSLASLVIGNFYDNSNVAFGLMFSNITAVLIALLYMNAVVHRHGLGEYDYDDDTERKRAIRSYFIQNIIALVCIIIFLVCLTLFLGADFGFIFFTVYTILYLFIIYLGYRRKFK